MKSKPTFRLIAVLVVGVALLASCSSDSDGAATDVTARSTTTVPLDEVTAAFCTDAKVFMTALNTLGAGIVKGETTIGDVQTAADKAKQASSAANDSKDALIASIEAHAAVAPAPGTTTTTLVAEDVATAHLAALDKAEKEAQEAISSIDASTLVSDAAADVKAAAFNLQLAWLALYSDAGCFENDVAGAQALHDYVVALQTDLKNLGLYTGEIDGLYGPETVAAVKTLQKNAGLTETGFLDPASQQALSAELAKASYEQSVQVTTLQQALTAAGYYSGPIDGVWSTEVEDAVKALQADQNLEQTGTVDPATLVALGAVLAIQAQAQATTTTAVPTTTPTTVADSTVPTTEP